MKKFDVFGVSDWPENFGETFPIFLSTLFLDEDAAVAAAKSAYSDDLQVIVSLTEMENV